MSTRDEFTPQVKRDLASRVSNRCSNPDCRAPTSGPQLHAPRAVNIGVAAHITGASPGGPRFDPTLSAEQRAGLANGIWLCQSCAKRVDVDPCSYTAACLRAWKETAEAEASKALGRASPAGVLTHVTDSWVSLPYMESCMEQLHRDSLEPRLIRAIDESAVLDAGWEPHLVSRREGEVARLKIKDAEAIGGYLILLKKMR
jgi:hypothetical protein